MGVEEAAGAGIGGGGKGESGGEGESGGGGGGGGEGRRDRTREFCSAHHIPPKFWPARLEASPYDGAGTVTVCGEG